MLSRNILLQQLPSCTAVRALAPCPGDRVIDMCAAPGGKTTHLAELLGDGGQGLVSVDRSLAKVRRIEALCKSHGFPAVQCIAADSRHLCARIADSNADVIEPPHKVEVLATELASNNEELPSEVSLGPDAEAEI